MPSACLVHAFQGFSIVSVSNGLHNAEALKPLEWVGEGDSPLLVVAQLLAPPTFNSIPILLECVLVFTKVCVVFSLVSQTLLLFTLLEFSWAGCAFTMAGGIKMVLADSGIQVIDHISKGSRCPSSHVHVTYRKPASSSHAAHNVANHSGNVCTVGTCWSV